MDDSSPFAKTAFRRRLEDLKARFRTIRERIFARNDSLDDQASCLFDIRANTCAPKLNVKCASYTPEALEIPFHEKDLQNLLDQTPPTLFQQALSTRLNFVIDPNPQLNLSGVMVPTNFSF